MHDPTKFPNIYFSKKKAQHNFCSFRFKVSIHKALIWTLPVIFIEKFLMNDLCHNLCEHTGQL